MDKKNTIIGVILLVAAFYFMFDSTKKESKAAQYAAEQANASAQQVQSTQSVPAQTAKLTSAYAPEENIKEELIKLSNDVLVLNLTNKGGAIANVELSAYEESQNSDKPFKFNAVESSLPAMGLCFYDANSDLPQPFLKKFALVDSSNTSATYKFIENGKYEITRSYKIADANSSTNLPYTVDVSTKITNIYDKPLDLKEVYLSLGTVPPTASDVYGANHAFMLYDSAGDSHFIRSSKFVKSNGFLGIGGSDASMYDVIKVDNAKWAALKNQFFAAVFTPKGQTSNGGFAIPIVSDENQPTSSNMRNSIGGFIGFDTKVIEPKQSLAIDGSYYVGPKELDRLYQLGAHQEEVMNYGWFGFVSRPLSRLMNWIHSWVAMIAPDWAWGWSIIILTLIVRTFMWPLTSMQIKSSQRMVKLQGPLQEVRKKYANDRQRLGQEQMKLYGEYGINPMAGCFPALVQIPIFIGLYYMLQTSCEIRFAHFLWINDLSLPDTLSFCPTIFGFPLHILPILNALVTFIQFHITPMPSTDKSQAMMFKLMPVIMLLFFYSFPSGLVLYWLVQSLLGILQALVVRHGADKVVLTKKEGNKKGFFQKLQDSIEQAQAAQNARGEEFKKLPLKEQLRIAREDALKAKKQRQDDRLKGTMYEKRKKNPGGRSTPPKR